MIVPMAKVQVLGPRRLLPEALRCLHAQGALHLRPLSEAGPDTVRSIPLGADEQADARSLERISRRVHDLLPLLPGPDAPSGAEEGLPDLDSSRLPASLDAVESEAHALDARRVALHSERDLLARYERLLTAVSPLLRVLEGSTRVETIGLLVRRDRRDILALVEAQVARITAGAYTLHSRDVDREQVAVLLTVPREATADLARLLFEQGIAEIRLPDRYARQPLVTTLALLLRRSRELPGEIAEADAEQARLARRWRAPLRALQRQADVRLARLRAVARCGATEHAFVISGWVPAERCPGLRAVLEGAFAGRVALVEHPIAERDYDAVPVVLRNGRLVAPFEVLLSLLPPPRYGSVDPTPFMAGFFPVFFGLMLGDVGYGAVALAAALVAKAKRWGGADGARAATVAVACAISAIVFGILFGEVFGSLGPRLGLEPLLLDRKHAVLPFLGLALALGGVHVLLGLGLGLWTALRHHDRAALLAKGSGLGVLMAAVALLSARAGYLPAAAATPALAVLAVFLVTLLAAEGVMGPLEVLRTMGNVLSYARLMALGMASLMLADVANRMAGMFGLAALGLAAALLLHAVNFALGCFSPAIQSLRLHYVEFFDKFYEDGGRRYEPFSLAS